MDKRQFSILHDCIDRLNSLRNPNTWETMGPKLIRKEIQNSINGLRSIGVNPIDLVKASQAMSYGEPKLAYQFLFVTSFPKSRLAEQFNRSLGRTVGSKGAFHDLIELYKSAGKIKPQV